MTDENLHECGFRILYKGLADESMRGLTTNGNAVREIILVVILEKIITEGNG